MGDFKQKLEDLENVVQMLKEKGYKGTIHAEIITKEVVFKISKVL